MTIIGAAGVFLYCCEFAFNIPNLKTGPKSATFIALILSEYPLPGLLKGTI